MMAFTCPQCNRTSNHPRDAQESYCGACRAFTGVDTPEARMLRELRAIDSRDPLHFTAGCLERALREEENGGDWLASMLSDLSKFTGDKRALAALEPLQWGPLLEAGRASVEHRAAEMGMGYLRR